MHIARFCFAGYERHTLSLRKLIFPGLVLFFLLHSSMARTAVLDSNISSPEDKSALLPESVRLLSEFEELMAKRVALAQDLQANAKKLQSARATSGEGAQGLHTPTGKAYRKAVMDVESAIDSHPQFEALQEGYEELQNQKLELSAAMSELVAGWRRDRDVLHAEYDRSVLQLSESAWSQKRELLLREDARSPGRLSSAGQRKYEEIESAFTNKLSQITAEYRQSISKEGLQLLREESGSDKMFAEMKATLHQIRQDQEALKIKMQAAREALRKNSTEIAKLQKAALAASREHVKAIQAREDIAKALAFLQGARQEQRALDEQAYALYNQIFDTFPDVRDELNALARKGGLVLASTVSRSGDQAGMTSERNH